MFGRKITSTVKDCSKKLGSISNKNLAGTNFFGLLSVEFCEKIKSQDNTSLTTSVTFFFEYEVHGDNSKGIDKAKYSIISESSSMAQNVCKWVKFAAYGKYVNNENCT